MAQPPDWEAEFLGSGGAASDAAADAALAAAAAANAADMAAPPLAARPPWALRVLRSVQLDAERLDAELRSMLHEQLSRALAVQGGALPPARVAALEPEITAALAALVWARTLALGRATPGSQLMNLRYRDERPFAGGLELGRTRTSALASAARESAAAASAATRAAGAPLPPSWVFGDGAGVEGGPLTPRQRALFGLGYCVLPYLWVRAGRAVARAGGGGGGGYGGGGNGNGLFFRAAESTPAAAAADTRRRGGGGQLQRPQPLTATAAEWARVAMPRIEAAYRVACFLNLLAFLRRGTYRTLLERALSARLVPERPCAPRSVSFEYLNRQLVWQELSEFVLFVLPLLDARRLRSGVRRWLPQPAAAGGAAAAGGPGSGGALAGGGGAWALAPPLPGEEEEEGEDAAAKADKGWWSGKRGGRRRRRGTQGAGADAEGDRADGAAGANGSSSSSSGGALRKEATSRRGGAVGGWLAQQLGGAASAMAAAVAAGAAHGMGQGDGGEQDDSAGGGGRREGDDAAAAATSAAVPPAAPPEQAPGPPGPCPLCGAEEILTPYAALPCRHVFCYYCLRANTEGDGAFACPVDGRRVKALRRWAPAELFLLSAAAAAAEGEWEGGDGREATSLA